MMMRGISTIALSAVLLPLALQAQAQDKSWMTIAPPGASPGVIHRPYNDPISAAAAAAAQAANMAIGPVDASQPGLMAAPAISIKPEVIILADAGQGEAPAPLEAPVLAVVSDPAPAAPGEAPSLASAGDLSADAAPVEPLLDDDPDLRLMSEDQIKAETFRERGAVTISARPRLRPLPTDQVIEMALAGTPWAFRSESFYAIVPGEKVFGFAMNDFPAHERFALESLRPQVTMVAAAKPVIEAPRAPLTRMELLAQDLVGRYGSESVDYENDLQRLADIAQMSDESYEIRNASAVSYSDEAPVADAQQAASSSEVLEDLLALRNQQIQQLQMAMTSGYGGYPTMPTAANAVPGLIVGNSGMIPGGMPTQMAQAPLDGVPSLDYRGALPEAMAISASDVPAGSSPFAPVDMTGQMAMPGTMSAPAGYPYVDPNMIAGVMAGYGAGQMQAPSAPVTVGHGENLLLQGWQLGLTGSGQIGMYLEGNPSSVIELSEGMVMGSIGRVLNVGREGDEIVARFDSGDEIRSPVGMVRLMNTGATDEIYQ